MKRSRKPSVNPAHQWEQLTAAVIEFGKNVRALHARMAAVEAHVGLRPDVDDDEALVRGVDVTKN